MTAEDWRIAEEKLMPPYGRVSFEIDEYRVDVVLELKSKTTYVYVIYVNGRFKGEWLTKDCEIRRRFYCHSKKNILTPKKREELIRKFGKREYNRFVKENPELCYLDLYKPYFGTFKSLKSSFLKNNTDITLID